MDRLADLRRAVADGEVAALAQPHEGGAGGMRHDRRGVEAATQIPRARAMHAEVVTLLRGQGRLLVGDEFTTDEAERVALIGVRRRSRQEHPARRREIDGERVNGIGIAAGSDPDTVHTLAVDLTPSRGVLLPGTAADADQGNTLCLVGGELVAYQQATLTAQ